MPDDGLYVAGEISGAVYIVGSIVDADLLRSIGYSAVCPIGPWTYSKRLKGLPVCIMAIDHPEAIAASLYGVASEVQIADVGPSFSALVDDIGQGAALEQMVTTIRKWAPPTATLDTISATELQTKDIPPIRFLVNGLLPTGLNLLVSPPKYGKSWAALDLCLSVAGGRPFLGYQTNRAGCLYLALEDSQRRLKDRMGKVLAGRQAPEGFYFATVAETLDTGLLDQLTSHLQAHPDTELIVIDTLQRVRGAPQGREGSYANDYRELSKLKMWADNHNICLLLVHHLRKMKDEGDPFAMISGTAGILGAADTALVLTKGKRGDDTATLSITGRDVESVEIVVCFDRKMFIWKNLGDAKAYAEQQAAAEYMDDPIVATVREIVKEKGWWEGTSSQLMDAGLAIAGESLAPSPRDLTNRLKALGKYLADYDGIAYSRKRNGTGAGKHTFQRISTVTNGTNGSNGENGSNIIQLKMGVDAK